MNSSKHRRIVQKTKTSLLIALIAISFSACASSPTVTTKCPPLVDYSADFKAGLVSELRSMKNDAHAIQALSDYATLREQVRLCGVD